MLETRTLPGELFISIIRRRVLVIQPSSGGLTFQARVPKCNHSGHFKKCTKGRKKDSPPWFKLWPERDVLFHTRSSVVSSLKTIVSLCCQQIGLSSCLIHSEIIHNSSPLTNTGHYTECFLLPAEKATQQLHRLLCVVLWASVCVFSVWEPACIHCTESNVQIAALTTQSALCHIRQAAPHQSAETARICNRTPLLLIVQQPSYCNKEQVYDSRVYWSRPDCMMEKHT